MADLLLNFMVDQIVDNRDQLIDESVATCHCSRALDLFPTIGTFRLDEQTSLNAGLTEQFGAMRAHHGTANVAKTNVAGQKIFELLF